MKGKKMKIRLIKLKCSEYDEEKYSEFIKDQTRQLIKRGFDPKTAASQAREIATMYRHHFRVWK